MSDYFNFDKKIQYHFYQLHKYQKKDFRMHWGSYLFDGKEYKYDERMIDKQNLLYQSASEASSVLEIGTYLGHSLLIMLSSNEKLNITSIDISSKYAKNACEYLKKKFPLASIKFIEGNSLLKLKNINDKYDLFHIDGDHQIDIITKEFNLIKKLRKKNLNVIFDDFDCCIDLINNILSTYDILKVKKTTCYNRNILIQIKLSNNKIKFYYNEIIFFVKSNFSFFKRIIISQIPLKTKNRIKKIFNYKNNLKY